MRVECHLGRLNTCKKLNQREFTKTRNHDGNEFVFKIRPHSNGHELEEYWTAVDKDLLKLEKYTLIPGFSINFFFGSNDAQLDRKLVQAASRLQPSSPALLPSRAHRFGLPIPLPTQTGAPCLGDCRLSYLLAKARLTSPLPSPSRLFQAPQCSEPVSTIVGRPPGSPLGGSTFRRQVSGIAPGTRRKLFVVPPPSPLPPLPQGQGRLCSPPTPSPGPPALSMPGARPPLPPTRDSSSCAAHGACASHMQGGFPNVTARLSKSRR